MNSTIPVVFIATPKDFVTLKALFPLIKQRIKSQKYILISRSQVKDEAEALGLDGKRTGWYLQQFLKMALSLVTPYDHYLIWDADTVPLKDYVLDEGHLTFDVKTEYHKPYFDTLTALIPDLKKSRYYSYIAEHMVIKTSYMKELIGSIDKSPYQGQAFYHKIINAVSIEALSSSGFSEFETYGTFVSIRHPGVYDVKSWHSLRTDNDWCTPDILDNHMARWISKAYDSVSFDNWIKVKKMKQSLMKLLSHVDLFALTLRAALVPYKVKGLVKRILFKK